MTRDILTISMILPVTYLKFVLFLKSVHLPPNLLGPSLGKKEDESYLSIAYFVAVLLIIEQSISASKLTSLHNIP